jgi:hypothetical protein
VNAPLYRGLLPSAAFQVWWNHDGKLYGANVLPDDRVRTDLMKYAFMDAMKITKKIGQEELLAECRAALFESAGAESFRDLIARIDAVLEQQDRATART